MAVTLGDPAVPIVYAQLSLLMTADLPAEVDGFPLRVKMAGRAIASAALDIPATAAAMYHMMGIGAAFAYHISFSFSNKST